MSTAENIHTKQRPPIVLTTFDREKLFTLLDNFQTVGGSETAQFLREEIARAEIVPDNVPSNSVVRMGCEVKFIDYANERIRRATLVFPEQAHGEQCISVLSFIGSALIGLGPGQSIRWMEQGVERGLAVVEVHASERASPRSQMEEI